MGKRQHTQKRSVFMLLLPLYVCLAVIFGVLISRGNMQLLAPTGLVADYQSKILWGALAFAAVVGTTIIVSFFVIIFRYTEGKAQPYEPTWTTGKGVQLLAWSVPSIVILVISGAVWATAHAIDPYEPLASTKPPVTVQVIALRWKWLFLYPNDHIATVNYMEVPVGTPINLQLTADAPMSSFWVPSLSGQIYAMTGMVTQLHIQADKTGEYPGAAAEINGDGYSGMDFTVRAVSPDEYAAWKTAAGQATAALDFRAYTKLAEPSSYNKPATYRATDPSLFNEVVMQFMAPTVDGPTLHVRGMNL